jgi:hypothetical protein
MTDSMNCFVIVVSDELVVLADTGSIHTNQAVDYAIKLNLTIFKYEYITY